MRILERKILADFLKSRLAKTPRSAKAKTPRSVKAKTPRSAKAKTPRSVKAKTPHSAKADSQVIAPVEVEGRLYFQQLDPDKLLAELAWPVDKPGAAALTVTSIKEFFFPRRQELYEQRPEGIIPRAAPGKKQRLLLFPRSCDTRGLTILDRVFLGEVEDESYRRARENTTVVGLHCLQPDRHCFCTSLGGGPFDTEGMDLALTPLDADRFLAQGVTEKGQALLASLGGKEAGEAEHKLLAQLRTAAEAAIRRTIEVPDHQTMAERFDSPYWQEASRACLTCGICSYLCPTCHCFDIVDEGYLRLRCWDTCSSETFTRMAAGEDHRKQKRSRYRQRVYHKFSYFKENFGTHSCVGCGRCIRHCPVKIDIVEIVNGIASAAPAGRLTTAASPAKEGEG
jgi:ferredoxin